MLEQRDQWGQALRRRTTEQGIPVPTSTPCHAELPETHSVLHQTTHLPSVTNRSWNFSSPWVESVFPAVLGMFWTPTLFVTSLGPAVLPDAFGQERWLWVKPVRFPLPFNWGETFSHFCNPGSSTAAQRLLAGFCVSSCAFSSYLAVRKFQRWCLCCLCCAGVSHAGAKELSGLFREVGMTNTLWITPAPHSHLLFPCGMGKRIGRKWELVC